MKIKVRVVPSKGKSREVEVEATAAPLRDVLKAANVSANNMQVAVNGSPANLDQPVPDGATVTVTEKARGS